MAPRAEAEADLELPKAPSPQAEVRDCMGWSMVNSCTLMIWLNDAQMKWLFGG